MCENETSARRNPDCQRGFLLVSVCIVISHQSVSCVNLFCRFIRGAWGPCSRSCGAGTQRRTVKCQVLLSFSQTVADLPDDECEGQKPPEMQPCYRTPCLGVRTEQENERIRNTATEQEELHDWEYNGFTECSELCGGGE